MLDFWSGMCVTYHIYWVEKGRDSKLLLSKPENELAVPEEGNLYQIHEFFNLFFSISLSC